MRRFHHRMKQVLHKGTTAEGIHQLRKIYFSWGKAIGVKVKRDVHT